MVRHDGPAARGVHLRGEFVTDADLAFFERADVRIRAAALLRVSDDKLRADIAELAGVARLAAGFRIERSAVEEHLALLTGPEPLDGRAALEQRGHLADVG